MHLWEIWLLQTLEGWILWDATGYLTGVGECHAERAQGRVQSLERSQSAHAAHGREAGKANYSGEGVIAPSARKRKSRSRGRRCRIGEAAGGQGEGAGNRGERGRFGVRGWLHTKERAAGSRFDAERDRKSVV